MKNIKYSEKFIQTVQEWESFFKIISLNDNQGLIVDEDQVQLVEKN